jgi:nucleoid DNA-binding protein
MANDKLTWLELRKAVAEHANTSEQEAGAFLSALLDSITEGLKSDKQVKIKGLGSFSLKAIAPRKSVNIATGEEFIIEGYNKVTFNAESMLKESVEKRIEQPKTEAIMAELNNDPIKKLGEQANEIVDILAELGQAPTTNETPRTESKEVVETTIIPEEPEIKEEENVQVEKQEEPKVEEIPANTSPTVSSPILPGKKCNWVCWAILVALLLGIVGTGWYFKATLAQWWQCIQDCQPSEEIVYEEIMEEPIVVPLAEQPREYVNFIGIERVGKNSRLAWIAYKYYAQKDLWVFIYEANRDIIKHPAHVLPGQYIRIPDLSEEYRNLYNPELKQLVDSLAIEYLK